MESSEAILSALAALSAKFDALDAKLDATRAEHSGVDPEFTREETARMLRMSVSKLDKEVTAQRIGFRRKGRSRTHGASHIREYQIKTDAERKTPRHLR